MTVNDLVLFAKNTGELYPNHLALAQEKQGLKYWVVHVKHRVLPAYRKACHEPHEGMTLDSIDQVAAELQRYYERHVSEF